MKQFPLLAVRMARPRTVVLIWLFMCIGHGAVSGHYGPRLLLTAASLAAWYVHATCVNDRHGLDVDRINLLHSAERPLVQGSATPSDLRVLGAAAAACALMAAAGGAGWAGVGIIAALLVLDYLYSSPPVQLSHRGAAAPLLLPLGYVAGPVLLGATSVTTAIPSRLVVLVIGLYLAFVGRSALKDFRDIDGDRQCNKRTFLVRHGVRATVTLSAVGWISGAAALVYFCRDFAVVGVLIGAFTVAILALLWRLATEAMAEGQQVTIALIGTMSNTAALVVLGALDTAWHPIAAGEREFLLISIALFGLGAARANWGAYRLLRQVRPDLPILVIVGPSAAGKTTLANTLHRERLIELFPSWTTRPPRPGETDGIEHRFVSEEEFAAAAPSMDETIEYAGHKYGMPAIPPPEPGRVRAVVMRPDLVELFTRHYPNNVVWSIEDSPANLEARLQSRGEDPAARLGTYAREMESGRSVADRVIANNSTREALAEAGRRALAIDFGDLRAQPARGTSRRVSPVGRW
jgi:guanylate kinase